MAIFQIIVLTLSGLLLTYAGLNRMIKPLSSLCLTQYGQNTDIKIEFKSDVFNEMRSAGAQLFFIGLIILLGIFVPEVRLWSYVFGVVTFLGYAFGRIIALIFDGKVCKEIMSGLYSEIVLGVLNAVCLGIMVLS
jgi:hypothetical protein